MNSPTNLAAFRMSKAAKDALLRGEVQQVTNHPHKLALAKAWLGTRYVLHPEHAVKRLPAKVKP